MLFETSLVKVTVVTMTEIDTTEKVLTSTTKVGASSKLATSRACGSIIVLLCPMPIILPTNLA